MVRYNANRMLFEVCSTTGRMIYRHTPCIADLLAEYDFYEYTDNST